MLDKNCSYFQYHNITPPNVEQQLDAMGKFAVVMSIGGGITTSVLTALFVLNVFTNIKRSPARRRRLLAWITSMPLVVSWLSLMMFLVPRAGDVCDIVKQVYLPFVLMHFIDLALLIQGGEEGVLSGMIDVNISLSLCQPPCCCFGLCFRKLDFNKFKLRAIKGLIYQAPVFQFVLIVIMTVLDHAEFLSRNNSDALYQFFSMLNILAFAFGIWGFNILNSALSPLLRKSWTHYILRSKVLSVFVIILKMQNFALGISYYVGAIPCVVPYVSPVTMRKTIDASLSLIESLLFGIIFHFAYQVKDISEMKRASQASRVNLSTLAATPRGSPNVERRLLPRVESSPSALGNTVNGYLAPPQAAYKGSPVESAC